MSHRSTLGALLVVALGLAAACDVYSDAVVNDSDAAGETGTNASSSGTPNVLSPDDIDGSSSESTPEAGAPDSGASCADDGALLGALTMPAGASIAPSQTFDDQAFYYLLNLQNELGQRETRLVRQAWSGGEPQSIRFSRGTDFSGSSSDRARLLRWGEKLYVLTDTSDDSDDSLATSTTFDALTLAPGSATRLTATTWTNAIVDDTLLHVDLLASAGVAINTNYQESELPLRAGFVTNHTQRQACWLQGKYLNCLRPQSLTTPVPNTLELPLVTEIANPTLRLVLRDYAVVQGQNGNLWRVSLSGASSSPQQLPPITSAAFFHQGPVDTSAWPLRTSGLLPGPDNQYYFIERSEGCNRLMRADAQKLGEPPQPVRSMGADLLQTVYVSTNNDATTLHAAGASVRRYTFSH